MNLRVDPILPLGDQKQNIQIKDCKASKGREKEWMEKRNPCETSSPTLKKR